MDTSNFDALTRDVATPGLSRRGTFKLLAGTALAAVLARAGFEEAAARCAKLGAKCKRSGDCCKGTVCKRRKCACKAGTTRCNGTCRNLKTDRANCGACGRQCGDGETCSDGFCVKVSDVPGDELLDFPAGLAVGADGTLIVVDSDQHQIEVFDPNSGEFSLTFGERGTGDGQFDSPTGVAFAGEDLYVADKGNHRIQRFDSRTGAHELSFGFFGSGVNQFRNPTAVAVDILRPGSGTVYVADTGNHLVKQYSLNGFFLDQFGGLGTGEGKLDRPIDLAISRIDERTPKIYVVDFGNNRVQIFDKDEQFVGSFGRRGTGNGEFSGPRGIAIGPDGTVFVTDGGNDRVQQFTADGAFLRAFGGSGSAPGRFQGPEGIALERDGTIHVADAGNSRIQTFRPVPV